MAIAVTAVSVLLVLACLTHFLVNLMGVSMIRTLPVLEREPFVPPARWPRVSVIVAACDEADTLGAAMTARLADDYPDVEWILVDDRSTDGTGAIVDALAAADPRVRPVHVTHLPDGWLGKVHALQRGLDAASGEWILFSDADVHFAPTTPGTLRRAIARCEARGHDLLAIVPQLASGGFVLDVLYSSFFRATAAGYQVRAVEDPRSRAAVGGGSFNLVRRAALDRTAGLAWIKLEVADDVALARQVKQAGGRPSVAAGQGLVTVAWYRSVRELAVGLEKASFSLMGAYSLPRHLLVCGLLVLSALAPFLAATGLGVAWPWLRWLGLGTALCDIATAVAINLWWRGPWIPALFIALADLVSALFMARAGVVAVWRGGIRWRGTLYPLDALRRERRVSLL